ncbi:MAG TPA: WbqC family protein [Pyrinomonadaceae bacterium]|nr:WbqC family protein [Pyrinomonadaceae bacterium]
MKRIVISQPMFFPWVGLFEQIRLADVYVHYDDVQFSKGSFVNRVQVKTSAGMKWLTVPLQNLRLGQEIRAVMIDDKTDWRRAHLDLLSQSYASSPFKDDMMSLVQSVYQRSARTIAEVAVASMEAICDYFSLTQGKNFATSSQLGIGGKSSQRVVDLVKRCDCDVYITGHGARYYLDHELFESSGVRVEYMDYRKLPYRQLHGEFTPYVSALDLIANEGRDGSRVIASRTLYWKDFIK